MMTVLTTSLKESRSTALHCTALHIPENFHVSIITLFFISIHDSRFTISIS